MPYYDFEDTETGEVFELNLKIAEKEDQHALAAVHSRMQNKEHCLKILLM